MVLVRPLCRRSAAGASRTHTVGNGRGAHQGWSVPFTKRIHSSHSRRCADCSDSPLRAQRRGGCLGFGRSGVTERTKRALWLGRSASASRGLWTRARRTLGTRCVVRAATTSCERNRQHTQDKSLHWEGTPPVKSLLRLESTMCCCTDSSEHVGWTRSTPEQNPRTWLGLRTKV